MRRLIVVSFLILLGICSFSVLGSAGTSDQEFVVAITVLGDHFDPHRPPGNAAYPLMAVFDGLTRLNTDGELCPSLAQSWEAVDETTWRFHLRNDVSFHNGEQFTAEVVKQNIARMLDPKEPRASYFFSSIVSYGVVDDYTIDVVTVRPDPLMPYKVSGLFVGPASMVGNPKSDQFNAHPVGTGPFEFVEWIKGERIVLRANKTYFRGAPAFSRVVFREIPDASSQIAELLVGGVDIIEQVRSEFIAKIEASGVAHIAVAPGAQNQVVGLRPDIAPFSDKRVRQAVNYALDIESIISAILGGYAHHQATPIHPSDFGFNPDVLPYPYDPAKARELLAEAGYKDGLKVDFAISSGVGGSSYAEVAQAIAFQLGEVGIQASIVSMDFATLRQRLYTDKSISPMYCWNWKTWFNDPDIVMFGLYYSDTYSNMIDDPTLDAMILDARFCMDAEKRSALYKELQALIREEAYYVPLYYLENIYAVSNRISWTPRVDERIYVYDAVPAGGVGK
ncbi:MAG: ABC transporter substrate-binding protein [Candidatus Bipolaricaulis sp.]|nr:ABC transporter substrate-binding protein [Candidatus Bipolaricaulis sp.]